MKNSVIFIQKNKTFGQIVTFQAPVLFKQCVDNAVKLYSAGGTKEALLAEWDEILPALKKVLAALWAAAQTPSEIPGMSLKEKEIFAKAFQSFDKLFAQLKSFTNYDDKKLSEYGITEEEYVDYAGHYLNVLEELKAEKADSGDDIMYAATHYGDGVIPNESAIKTTIDYAAYKAAQEKAVPKFKYYAQMMAELRKTLEEEIRPLINH